MNIAQFLKENASNLIGSDVQIAPNISEKKLNSAIKSYANGVIPEHVILLHDSTLLKNAKDGLLFLGDCFYFKPMFEKPIVVPYKDLLEIRIDREKIVKGDKEKEQLHVVLTTESTTHILTNKLHDYSVEKFVKLIEGIIALKETQEFENVSQITPLADMSESYKLSYLKVLANFTMSDDGKVDAKEYSELMSLVTRIHLSSEYRLKLRAYIGSVKDQEETMFLIGKLKEKSISIDFSIVQKSLFKDLLYLYKLKNSLPTWEENKFLTQLRDEFSIQSEEIDLICAAIKNDEDILTFRKNDSDIVKSMKDIAAKAAAVGMPLTAIYLSGSVVGLSAAGLTSGLATLGMGGILGFSSMFTGIGAIVLIGVGTYQGLKKITGIKDIENNKQREYMLQKIIRNSQQTLDYLLEDINEISRALVVSIQKGNENSEKINKLSSMLTMLSESARFSAKKQNESQKEQMITHLPLILSTDRLEELTPKPTQLKIREFILKCYTTEVTESMEEVTPEVTPEMNQGFVLVGGVQENAELSKLNSLSENYKKTFESFNKTQNGKLEINENLSLEDLEMLQESFENIGYFELTSGGVAEVTGSAKRIAKNLFGDR